MNVQPASFTENRDYWPPCQNCGHEYEDHGPADDRDDDDNCRFCDCEMYDDERAGARS